MSLYMFRTLLCPSSGAFHHCTCSLWLPCDFVLVASSSTVLLTKFYDFKTEVHLVGFYSILWMMMHGTMNMKMFVGVHVHDVSASGWHVRMIHVHRMRCRWGDQMLSEETDDLWWLSICFCTSLYILYSVMTTSDVCLNFRHLFMKWWTSKKLWAMSVVFKMCCAELWCFMDDSREFHKHIYLHGVIRKDCRGCNHHRHLVLQMEPHVISFYGVPSRIRFMFLLFPQVSRNWGYRSEPPLKPSPMTCYKQFRTNSVIMLMFVESQRVHM
jgi:hypothetical protein